MIRVVVAEDNALLRDGVRRILEAEDDLELVGSCGSLDELLDLAREQSPDVVVTVENLPQGVTAPPLTLPKGQNAGKLTLQCAAGVPHQAVVLRIWGEAAIGSARERRLSSTTETYNIQGTAYRRDLIGPVLVVGD